MSVPKKDLSDLFEDQQTDVVKWRGKDIYFYVEMEVINFLIIDFASYVAKPVQGLRVWSDSPVQIEDQTGQRFAVWVEDAPNRVIVQTVESGPTVIKICNIWLGPHDATFSWVGNAGMLVTRRDWGLILRCNSGPREPNFQDLVVHLFADPVEINM